MKKDYKEKADKINDKPREHFLGKNYRHGLTVGSMKKFFKDNPNISDDAPILIERIEDSYFEGSDISGCGGCKDTEDGIYPPGSKAEGWGVHLKEGEPYWNVIRMNDNMREEIAIRENGGESEYPKIEDPSKLICEDEDFLKVMKTQYHSAWCFVKYRDEDEIVFIDIHY